MSTTNDKYQPRMCRLCLSTTATHFSLIDGGEAPKMLEAVTSLKILPTDDISTVTCLKCVLNLKLAFILQQNILGAEQRFRQRMTQVIKQEVVSNSSDLEEMEVSTEELTSPEVPVTIKDDIDIEEEELQPLVLEEKCELYQCDICDIVLSSQRCLHNHKNSFHKIAGVKCKRQIKKTLRTRCSLRIARMSETMFACGFCGVKAKSELLIQQHKDYFHKSKLCRECNKFVQVALFTQHTRTHHIQTYSRILGEKERTEDEHTRTHHIRTYSRILRENKITEDDDRMSKEKEKGTTFTDDSRPSEEKEPETTFTNDNRPSEEEEKGATFTDDNRPSEEEEPETTFTDDNRPREEKEKGTTFTDDDKPNEEKDKPKHTVSCFTCGEVNPSKEHIKTHFPKKCKVCGEDDPSKKHMKEHFPKKCTVCDEINPSKKHMTEHFPQKCTYCDEVNPSKRHMNDHSLTTKCRVCGDLVLRDHFSAHKEDHRNKLVVCELCGKQVESSKLRSHIKYYHNAPKHKCEQCDMVFRGKTRLTYHLKKEHLKQADFVCQTCGKTFYARKYLKKHVQSTHEKLRPHICKYCKVGFSTRYAMLTHERKHTNETPYKCPVCGDGFRYNVSLKAHLKSKHDVEDELTYECDACHKKFASDAALISHSRIH